MKKKMHDLLHECETQQWVGPVIFNLSLWCMINKWLDNPNKVVLTHTWLKKTFSMLVLGWDWSFRIFFLQWVFLPDNGRKVHNSEASHVTGWLSIGSSMLFLCDLLIATKSGTFYAPIKLTYFYFHLCSIIS